MDKLKVTGQSRKSVDIINVYKIESTSYQILQTKVNLNDLMNLNRKKTQ